MPIDLASGNVHVDYPETRIAGKVELVWGRRFSNALAERHSPFWGPGWTNRYLSTLTRHAGGFEFFGPDGAIEMLPDREHAVQGGEWRRYLHAYIELFLRAGRYVVQRWSAESGEVWRYIFEPTFDGRPMRLSAIEDLSGNRIELQWNSAGKLSGIEQPAEGRTLLLAYSHSGRLLNVRLQGSDGSIHPVTSYEYDAEDRLARASDALQQEDSFAYDAQGRLIREVAKHGGLMSYRYDSSGRCVWQSGSDHYDEKWMRYLDAPRITEMTDSRGATHRYQWLPSGQIVSAWNPLGGHTRTEYDEYGRTTVKTTPEGATTQYGYDERGNRNQIVNALGNTFLLKFNQLHQPVELVDPHGQIWQRHYDSSNRLLASVDPLGGTWRFEYDTRGDAVTLVNPRGDLQRCTYANGSPHRTTDWLGQCTTLEFDAVGRLCSRTDPLGQTWKYTYDVVGNLVRTELPDGAIELASYTAAGDVLRSIDPQGRTKRFRYGPCRRLIQTIDGNDAKISYNWGSEPGFLDSVINEVGDIYRFEYDEAGRCVAEVGFDGRRVEFEYNRDSHCIRTINGAGEIVDHVRDPLGAIVEQRLPGGASVRYVYDKMGELIEGVNADSKIRFDRDTMGRLVGETQGDHWIHYSLDALGVTTSLQTGVGHKASYEIDANGLWSTLTTGQTTEFHFSRDSRTQERFRRFANDTVLATHYDAVGRVVEQTLQARDSAHQPLESRFHRHYARDRSGLVIAIDSEARGRIAFAFDPAEQLLGASRSNGPTEIFEYDSAANLTRKGLGTDFALDNAWISYAPGNRLVSKADDQYEFDAQGRLIQRIEGAHTDHPRKWSFEWDALDQLLSVTRPDGEVWHYAYDAFSRRIAKQSPREKTEYVWSGHVPIHEKSSTDPGWTTNLFAQDSFELVGQIRNGVVFPILSDHLGQAQCMLDDSARVIWQSNSSAFGGSEFHTPDSRSELCNFSFPGQTKDFESGLHYNRFRYYDPSCGRFISQDPLRLPGGANPYSYVPNPIAWIDPWGLICQRLADTLPEEPGIYHIELNGEFYTGSGVNVRTRLSTSDHPAAHLLDDPNVNVMVYPVGLGSAAGDQRMTGHVLRGYEQGVMDQPSIRNTPQQNGSLNQIRAARATRTGEYSQDAANHGAARGGGVPY